MSARELLLVLYLGVGFGFMSASFYELWKQGQATLSEVLVSMLFLLIWPISFLVLLDDNLDVIMWKRRR